MWSDGGHKLTEPKPGIIGGGGNPGLCMNDGNSSTPLPPTVSFLHIGKDLFLIVGNQVIWEGGMEGRRERERERELLNVTSLIPPGAAIASLFWTYSLLPVGWMCLVYRQVFSS